MPDLLAAPQGNGLVIVGKRMSGMYFYSEGGVHAHSLVRARGTTVTDGDHIHIFLIDGQFFSTEWDGEHRHAVGDRDRRSALAGAHRHRIVMPEGGTLDTASDGEHDHDLMVEATAYDGTHDHLLQFGANSIKSLSPYELAELFPQNKLEDEREEMFKSRDLLKQIAKPQHGLVVGSLEEATAILSGEKTMLVKQVDLDVDGRNVYMLAGNMALGIWKLAAPRHVSGVELDGYGSQTLLRSDDRRAEWADDARFFLYNVEVVKVFDSPIMVDGVDAGTFAVQNVKPATEANPILKAEWGLAKIALRQAQDKITVLKEQAPKAAPDPRAASQKKLKRDIRLLKSDRPDAEEERFVLGIVLVPEEEDAQGDIYSEEEVRKAAHYFMENDGETGLMHKEILDGDVKIVENFLMPSDAKIDGVLVKKGTWLQGLRIISDKLWKAVKSGELTGLSIGGSAYRDPEAA